MPTSPKALGEVLTSKAYNFVKPRAVTNALERIIGRGLILAEGDEHKVIASRVKEISSRGGD